MSAMTSAQMDPSYPTFPVFACVGIILTLLPAYWHFKSGNVGTILYICWTLAGNVVYLVNSIVWAGNLGNPAPFWCDLSTKIMVGLSVGLPAASMVINRRLYMIATIRQVNISRSESRRNSVLELALGLGIPVIVMVLHVIVQGHRFDIYENIGCWPSTYVTPVTIVCVFMWPILLGMVSLVYASLSIRAFLKQRKQFNDVLQSTNSGLTIGRYFRLMALAATEIAFSLPFSIFLLITNVMTGLHPWISWEDTHFNFNRTEYVPFGIFQLFPRAWILVNVSRYALPVGGFFFFVYLGLSGEAGQFYRRHFWTIAHKCGVPQQTDSTAGASWIARPGASSNGQMRSLPPFAATSSFTSSIGKKDTSSMDIYPISAARGKANSSSDSLSLPPDLEDEAGHSTVGSDDLSSDDSHVDEVHPHVVTLPHSASQVPRDLA